MASGRAADARTDQRDQWQQHPIAEDDAAKRKEAKLGAREVVEVELLLVVLRQEVVGRPVPEDALPPRDFFHRDEHAEQRNPCQEPGEGTGASTLTPRCHREDNPRDEEAPERCPFERLVFLDASVIGIWVARFEPRKCAEEAQKEQVGNESPPC